MEPILKNYKIYGKFVPVYVRFPPIVMSLAVVWCILESKQTFFNVDQIVTHKTDFTKI